MSIWFTFIICGVVILIVGALMTRNADYIADRTGLGKAFVGGILLAGATSMPEMMTEVSAARMGAPNLVVGDALGSNLYNMVLLGVVDLWSRRVSVLANVALAQAFAAALAVLMTVLAGAFILLRLPTQVMGVGLDVLALALVYLVGMKLLRSTERGERITGAAVIEEEVPSQPEESAKSFRQRFGLPIAVASFALCTAVIIAVAPRLAHSAKQIAEMTGLGTTFVGTTLLALATSLPELASSFAAVRMGSYDLAVGNLFGSNAFNMVLLCVGDIFYAKGTLLAAAQPTHALTAMLGSALMMVALMSVVYRGERRQRFVQVDAALLVVLFVAVMFLLYHAGRQQ
jgi:cation:H+ antiporter